MYEWIDEVNKVVQGVKGKLNNQETRSNVTENVIKILNNHSVKSRVDCSSRVNTIDIVDHGAFMLKVETLDVIFTFKFVNGDKK